MKSLLLFTTVISSVCFADTMIPVSDIFIKEDTVSTRILETASLGTGYGCFLQHNSRPLPRVISAGTKLSYLVSDRKPVPLDDAFGLDVAKQKYYSVAELRQMILKTYLSDFGITENMTYVEIEKILNDHSILLSAHGLEYWENSFTLYANRGYALPVVLSPRASSSKGSCDSLPDAQHSGHRLFAAVFTRRVRS